VLIAAGRERVDDSSRRNVLLLVLCQATFMSTTSLTATVASLAGYALATDKALATLPITAGVVGTAVGTIPTVDPRSHPKPAAPPAGGSA
jgi:hypothetical protein